MSRQKLLCQFFRQSPEFGIELRKRIHEATADAHFQIHAISSEPMKSRLDRHAIGVDPLLSENSILMARSLHLSPFAVPASYFALQASYFALQASKDRSKDELGRLTAISTSFRFNFSAPGPRIVPGWRGCNSIRIKKPRLSTRHSSRFSGGGACHGSKRRGECCDHALKIIQRLR